MHVDKEWKGVVHFGRVDATREPKVLERFPFTIRIFPSIVSYAPTGDYDLLSLNAAFNPTEIKRALKELLSKAVDYVDANEAVRFLQLAPEYYDPRSISKFNVLLLPKKQNVPFDYLKYGMNNMGVLNLGVVPHDQRTGVLKMLKTDQHKNMLISYKKYNANGEPSHTMESAEVSVAEMTSILTLTVRHSIVEMYKNNYRHYCFFPIAKEDDERASRSSSQSEDEEESQEQQGTKEETKEEDRLVCVLALLDGSLDEADRLKNFQRYVHMRYAEGYARPTKDRAAVSHTQYGTIRLGWHPELQKLILQTQQSFKLERSRLNYLLISAENDAYSIIAPMNCTSRSV